MWLHTCIHFLLPWWCGKFKEIYPQCKPRLLEWLSKQHWLQTEELKLDYCSHFHGWTMLPSVVKSLWICPNFQVTNTAAEHKTLKYRHIQQSRFLNSLKTAPVFATTHLFCASWDGGKNRVSTGTKVFLRALWLCGKNGSQSLKHRQTQWCASASVCGGLTSTVFVSFFRCTRTAKNCVTKCGESRFNMKPAIIVWWCISLARIRMVT